MLVGTVRLVKPQKAEMLESRIIQLGRAGQLRGKMTEQQLIRMLEQIGASQQENKPKITVTAKVIV